MFLLTFMDLILAFLNPSFYSIILRFYPDLTWILMLFIALPHSGFVVISSWLYLEYIFYAS